MKQAIARTVTGHHCIAFFALLVLAHGVMAKPLSREDVFGLEYADNPQFSPDGRQLVYQRHFIDVMNDRIRANLWLVDIASGEQQPLTTGPDHHHSPLWSPDGRRLAYIGNDHKGKPQIFMRWMDSGREAQLTQLQHGPGGLSWSPDGQWLVFHHFVAKKPEPMVKPLAKPEGAQWPEPAVVINRPLFRADGAGILPEGSIQLFMIPADGGTPRQLTHGPYRHRGTAQWTADGEALIFAANRHDDWEYQPFNSEIFRLELASGELTALTERFGPDTAPRLSPDGQWLAWLGFDDQYLGYANAVVHLMPLAGGETQVLGADLDRNIDAFEWSRDSKSLLIQFDDQGNGKIERLSLNGRRRAIAADVGGTSLGRPYGGGGFAVGARNQLVYTHTTTERPADLMLIDRNGKQHRLTRLNDDLLQQRDLARVEEIRYASSFDGREIQGWIAYPPAYRADKTYPLILEIHGGPFANYGDRFSTEVQLYAAAGYVILYTNPRGSTSYGAEFANLIHHRYPGEDYDDLMSGVDALIEKGVTSADQLYVTGGSGGGVLTAWIVGKTDRFQAAVVAKPVINWTSFVLTGDLTTFFYRYWFPGLPWEAPAEYQRRSPLFQAGNVTTPTMVLSGEADYRTPISEAEQFYQALKLQKVESVLVRIPGAPHYIAGRPSQLVTKVDHILAWFQQHPAEEHPGEHKARPDAEMMD